MSSEKANWGPVWQLNANSKSKQLLKYELTDWWEVFHIPEIYPIDVAFCTYIPILSHSHFLCKVFSTKLFKSQQLLLFHVFMKETETHASVHYSWSDSMSSLSDFLVNIYFPFCVPYGSVPDLTVMSWASVSLHYPALCQDIILLNP